MTIRHETVKESPHIRLNPKDSTVYGVLSVNQNLQSVASSWCVYNGGLNLTQSLLDLHTSLANKSLANMYHNGLDVSKQVFQIPECLDPVPSSSDDECFVYKCHEHTDNTAV